MREILFRGKRTDNGEWVEGYLAAYDLICSDYPEDTLNATGEYYGQTPYVGFVEVDPETVGQYTGLTDKNGKKIFEDDIVKAYNICGEEEGMGVVHWSGLFAAWHYANNKCMYGGNIASYEIIGNVHDNPELIKEV